MRSPGKTTAVALAGAVALSSAAYGIGTQVGGGNASAAGEDDRTRSFQLPAHPFEGLADELGVDADELRDALMDFGERRHTEVRDDFAAALAETLGKPVDEVRAALDEVRPTGGARRGPCGPHVSLRGLASELDVTRAELRKALREARANSGFGLEDSRDDLAAFLAERFNLSKEEVEDALPELPGPPRGLPDRPPGPPPFGWGALPG
jgi:hypothetical protein